MQSSRALGVTVAVSLLFVSVLPSTFAQDRVRLTVTATSAGNAPVLNLAKTDFAVQDSGKQRTVITFAGPESKDSAPPPLQANEFSNIPDFRETSGAIFVVFDTIDTRYLDERDARQMVLKFLARAAQAKHAVTLAVLSDKGLKLYHDYRTGSDVLLAAMAKAGLGGIRDTPPPAGVNEAQVNAEAARLTAFSKGDQSNPTPEGQLLRSNPQLVLTMFEDIGFAAAGLPGRKSLVWITNAVSFDIDPKTMQFKSPQIASHGAPVNGQAVRSTDDLLSTAEVKRIAPIWRQSIRALFDGGVAVYPYEVRGSNAAAANTPSQLRMKELAQLTGGKAYVGSNDPFPDILTISDGNTAGYVLGYTMEAPASADFHRVEATANRQNVEISSAAGYFPNEGTPNARASDEVGLALSSPLEYTGIRFKVAVAGMEEGTGGKKKVSLVIALPGDSGVLNEASGKVDIGLVARAINSAGQTVGNLNEGAGGSFPPDAVAQIKQSGFQLKRSWEVSPGECTVRFLVRDNQSGRMGDIIFPLRVK
jgi:VWFA-related protein